MGSYVDWVEETGSLSVLLPWDMPWNELRELLAKTNGLLLPGGGAELVYHSNKTGGAVTTKYQNRLYQIFTWVRSQNLNHDNYYPVWGTCLGMQESFISLMNNDGSV